MTAVDKLIDPFGRKITYLRLSVTDRCNFRCVYCMAEDMTFLPRQKLLCYEEIVQICQVFTDLGVEKIRITGGEPLIRSDIVRLTEHLHALPGLKTLAMTTNGSRLRELAAPLYQSGLRRLNISLDTLDSLQFQQLTRTGKLADVLAGIYAAQDAGFEHIKLNAVILKGRNDEAVNGLMDFVLENDLDISFIEEMPLGHISSHNRASTFCSSDDIREMIEQRYPLMPTLLDTGGPSTYFAIPGHSNRIGFISPHSHNFCASCNRVRMTSEGQLLLCLGNENALDLRDIIRRYPGQPERLRQSILNAISYKPREHDFKTNGDVQIVRFMNMTGG